MPEPTKDPWNLETDTRAASRQWSEMTETRSPALTVLAHPDRRRIGERAILPLLPVGREVGIARGEPGFSQPGERQERPLADSRISRAPIRLIAQGGTRADRNPDMILLDARATSTVVELDGRVASDPVELPWEALERGVVLCLSHHIVLLLHLADPLADPNLPAYGLVGASDAMARIRSEIRRLAPLDVPVLLRGETGTGKELVAAALHQSGPRANGPWVALNMAAISPSLAAAELFGAAKGAYTGSTRDRRGAFRRADGGTLFLDEIGDTPEEVQALLLRTLESREVQPVGAERTITVDVRLVTATDLDLETAVDSGQFRSPLLHRVAGYEIHLPPLRDRMEDFGRLFDHFLERELIAIGEARHLEPADGPRPWPPAEIIARLADRPWPGNIRQLRNAARQLAILGRDASSAELARWLESAGAATSRSGSPLPPAPAAISQPRRRARPLDVSDDQLIAVLRQCRYRVQDAAEQLGMSRAAVYKLMDRSSRFRKASDLDHTEITAALDHCAGDLTAMVERLEVSAPALRRRMRQLGFD